MHFKSRFHKHIDCQTVACCLTAAVMIVSISLIISMGETIQLYIFSMINGDSASIYHSAYKQDIIHFPTLRQWLMRCANWQFLVISSAIVLVSLREVSARKLFTSCLIASLIALISNDLFSAIVNQELSLRYITENAIADSVGAPMIAFIFLIAIGAGNFIYIHLKNHDVSRYIFAGMSLCFLAAALNIFTYYTLDLLYRPLPVELDIVTNYPVSGFLGFEGTRKDEHNAEGGHNQFFPETLDNDVFHWHSPADNNLQIEWRSLSSDRVFDMTITFVADCYEGNINKSKLNEKNKNIRVADIKKLKVTIDSGMSDFDTMEATKMWGELKTDFGLHTFFWLDHDDNAKKASYRQFVDRDATMKILNQSRDLVFFVNAALTTAAGRGLTDSNRTLNFEIDGKQYSIRSDLVRAKSEEEILKCRTLASKDAFKEDQTNIAGARRYLGAIISISKRSLSSAIYGIEDNELTVRGGNGWVTLTRLSDDVSSRSQAASLDFLSFEGSVVHFDIDGVSVSSQPIDQYVVFGDLVAELDSPKSLHFSGKAKALWKSGVRLNPTKWEKLSWEPRLFLMGLIASILGMVGRYVVARLKENADIQWLRALQRSTV